MLALASALGMNIIVIDISNAFQSNIIEDLTQRQYISLPAYYLLWLCLRWPNHPILKYAAKDLVIQTIRKLQGAKDAGTSFFLLLHKFLMSDDIGMKASTTNKGIYKWMYNGHKNLMAVTTDDFLFAMQH